MFIEAIQAALFFVAAAVVWLLVVVVLPFPIGLIHILPLHPTEMTSFYAIYHALTLNFRKRLTYILNWRWRAAVCVFFRRRHHSNRIAKQFHANFNDMTLCMDKMHFTMKANTRFGHSDTQ